MLKPGHPNYVEPYPEQMRALEGMPNIPSRKWHEHLYTCKVCWTDTRCSTGQSLLDAANAQHKEG